MQLTPQETALFGQIKTVRYLVTIAEPPTGFKSSSGRFFSENEVPSRVNHLVVFTEQNREFGPGQRSLRTFYQLLDDTITTAAATEILRQDALELTGVPLGTIKAQRSWEGDSAYFPHLSSESMGAGWYKDVEATQGQQGTFWAGSVMCVFFCFFSCFSVWGFFARGGSERKQKKNALTRSFSPSSLFPFLSFFNKRTFSRSFEDVERTSVYANYLALRWF